MSFQGQTVQVTNSHGNCIAYTVSHYDAREGMLYLYDMSGELICIYSGTWVLTPLKSVM